MASRTKYFTIFGLGGVFTLAEIASGLSLSEADKKRLADLENGSSAKVGKPGHEKHVIMRIL